MSNGIRLTGVSAVGTSFSTRSALTADVAALKVRDNTKFATEFDASKIDTVFIPTRTLVVGQSPPAGTLVPVGTPVDLRLTVKELIPLDGFKQIDPKVLEKFAGKSVGDVTTSYRGTDVEKVLGREGTADYDALSTGDKAVVNDYIRNTYGVDANADAAGAKNVYGNIKFLNDL